MGILLLCPLRWWHWNVCPHRRELHRRPLITHLVIVLITCSCPAGPECLDNWGTDVLHEMPNMCTASRLPKFVPCRLLLWNVTYTEIHLWLIQPTCCSVSNSLIFIRLAELGSHHGIDFRKISTTARRSPVPVSHHSHFSSHPFPALGRQLHFVFQLDLPVLDTYRMESHVHLWLTSFT